MRNFGMSGIEIESVQIINPEIAAHNIASSYVHSVYGKTNFPTGENVDFNSVAKLAETYEYAYSYAYNYIVHQNKITEEAE